jgi:hypothetical protein
LRIGFAERGHRLLDGKIIPLTQGGLQGEHQAQGEICPSRCEGICVTWLGLNWGDILLNTAVLAIVPLLIAAWGGHLAAEAITDPKKKRNVKRCFWLLFVFGVVATGWQQFRAEETDLEKNMNNNFAMAIAVQKMFPPPLAPIIEQKLVSNAPRSYLVYEGNPLFSGPSPTGTEGAAFAVGQPVGFNVHFKATGLHPVILLESAFDTEVVTDLHVTADTFDQAAIDRAVGIFLSEIKKERSRPTHKKAFQTLMQGDAQFNTAFAWTDDSYSKHRVVTQGDLDNVKDGSETWAVMSDLTYLDGKTAHHLRRCMWLMPPGNPPGLWHFCGGKFPDSD